MAHHCGNSGPGYCAGTEFVTQSLWSSTIFLGLNNLLQCSYFLAVSAVSLNIIKYISPGGNLLCFILLDRTVYTVTVALAHTKHGWFFVLLYPDEGHGGAVKERHCGV